VAGLPPSPRAPPRTWASSRPNRPIARIAPGGRSVKPPEPAGQGPHGVVAGEGFESSTSGL
jgi:hypothetical protein